MIEVNYTHNGTEAFTIDQHKEPIIGDNVDGFIIIGLIRHDDDWYTAHIQPSN